MIDFYPQRYPPAFYNPGKYRFRASIELVPIYK